MFRFFIYLVIYFSVALLIISLKMTSNENFYIHLNSDVRRTSPLQTINTIGNFVTFLSRKYILNGEYEVALSRIHYTKSWYNIEEDQLLTLVDNEGKIYPLTEAFPSGNYLTVDEIVELLNELYKDFASLAPEVYAYPPQFQYNNYSNIIRVRLGAKKNIEGSKKYLYPQMSDFLAEFLGLSDTNGKQYPFLTERESQRLKTKKIFDRQNQFAPNQYSISSLTVDEMKNVLKQVIDENKEQTVTSDPVSMPEETIKINENNPDIPSRENRNFEIQKSFGEKKKDKKKTKVVTMQSDQPVVIIGNITEYAYILAFKQVSLHGYVNNINIYCDLLKPVSVGNVDVPLLRAVATSTNDKFGDYVQYEPNQREYINVIYSEFDHIEVDIRDDFNNTVDFKFGKVYLSLHFRKINKNGF
jgi:hypothetical protein